MWYVIIQRDETGLFKIVRTDLTPEKDADVIKVYKGELRKVIREANKYIQTHKPQEVRTLTGKDISTLL